MVEPEGSPSQNRASSYGLPSDEERPIRIGSADPGSYHDMKLPPVV